MKENNPQAFPHMHNSIYEHEGMTLRDYFAAKAMQGFCYDKSSEEISDMVKKSYQIADAMLKERDND